MSNPETFSLSSQPVKKETDADLVDTDGPRPFDGDIEANNGIDDVMLDEELSRYETNLEMSRQATRRLSGVEKILTAASKASGPIPPMGGGRSLPAHVGASEDYAVTFDGPNDPLLPFNWPFYEKCKICFAVGIVSLSSTVGSGIYSSAIPDIMREFHVGMVPATLSTALYVFGFASGPILWGPLSELYGRSTVFYPTLLMFICFAFAVATAHDIQTIMLGRFFGGFVGAAPLVVAPGSMADVFNNEQRGSAIAIFAIIVFGGPMLAPIFGSFTEKNPGLGWRWCSYFSGLVGVVALIILVTCYKETHHALILVKKAETIRRRTGNWAIHAPHEEVSLSMKEILENNIARPLKMLFTEPIIFLITLYNSFIYGLLYLFLTAIPLIFEGKYGWRPGVAQLPYLSMLLGIFAGGACCVIFEGRYVRAMKANGGKPVPEERLVPMMAGGIPFAAGILWMGWAGYQGNSIHWIVPVIGIFFIGFGLITIFLPCLNYIIDCFLLFAASALAANTFMRSMFGGAFPLFARQMYVNMHIQWASTLLGCVGLAMVPVPFLFYRFGKKIRSKSKYAIDF